MEWTGLNELREKFLTFFESKEHKRLASAPLVPQDDNSLLLINSGMAPLKKYFLGQATPPSRRVTTCQKCIRTPDIERVGKTSRHGTFFEMLGNFSFGDYFKHEATAWAWEFITKELKLPVDRLWVSIYQDDDEAFEIWTKEVGVDPSHIVRLGKEDNFWEIGSGPCGPCSEIYFDRGEGVGCGRPECAVGCDCDRFVEFWNLVFSQFDSDGEGHYTPMERPNIDTGMGLERLACIVQGVDNLFEVDTVQNIMKHVASIAQVSYKEDPKTDVSLRVITDHIRSTVMLIGDGVVPQNEGRGYVLRRLLRRAARHGKLLGIHEPFLYKVCDTVIEENKTAYPELVAKADYIKKVIQVEEERFAKTIDQGTEILNALLDHMEENEFKEEKVLSGQDAFRLYDTFGFPIDLIKEMIAERHMGVDEPAFMKLMEEQRERARAARAKLDVVSWDENNLSDLADLHSTFVGYDTLCCDSKVSALLKEGAMVHEAMVGDQIMVVLEKTSFYAESGGQVGDTGVLESPVCTLRVLDCKKAPSGQHLHLCEVITGMVSLGDTLTAKVDKKRRQAIMRNHTAAHLLQAALRQVLGDHVHQAGQLVDDRHVRFDFSHFSAMTAQELQQVEDMVNEKILDSIPVTTQEMPIAEAQKLGAMALFGEKYGDIVRVCSVGDFSKEFCGGTHLKNTAQAGLFKILSESSVAAGVRRIEGVTGMGVIELMQTYNDLIHKASEGLKLANPMDVVSKIHSIVGEMKEKDKRIDELTQKIADLRVEGLFSDAKLVDGVRLISATFQATRPDALRVIADKIREKAPKTVAVLVSINEGKGTIVVACGKGALEMGVHAGKLVKEICSLTGGSGGGRPDSAMGGAGNMFQIDEAIAQVPAMLSKMVQK